MSNDNRLDRLEKVVEDTETLMPSAWEVRAEIERMKKNPEHQTPWTQRQVRFWITELEADLGQATMTHE